MKCVICKHGELVPGTTVVTRKAGTTTLVLKDVPALVCESCGEEYFESATSQALHEITQRQSRSGAEVVICQFHEAA